MVTRLELNREPALPAAFDLVDGDQVAATAETTEGMLIRYDTFTEAIDFVPGEASTVRFDLAAGARRPVEVWLPHDSVVELRELRVSDGATVAHPERRRRRCVHHGSSISHCFEANRPTETWPAIVARAADVDLQNLAFAGQCMLDPMVARTIRNLPAEVISVKAGINIVNGDTMRERTFAPALHGFLDTIRDGHPTTPIALVTPIICPIVEDDPGPTALGRDGHFHAVPRRDELAVGALTLQRIRALAADVVAARCDEGDENLHLVDGLALFGADDVADLDDDLHPNAAGYRRMGERFHSLLFADDAQFARPQGPTRP